jgi:hypothetical protein
MPLTCLDKVGLKASSPGKHRRLKLLFDETITEHLDIESIIFLSERLRQLLRGEEG